MIGSQVAHFRILSKIAEGGMGVVYKAEDLDLGRAVAIKVLPPHLVGDEDRRKRFFAEARTAAAVTHPNIATIHEIGEVDDLIFIAMECVEGQNLRKLIANKPLPMKETLRIATGIAEGLAAAHQARIAHRDLKPDNIMICADGRVKILDFGLARLLEEGREENEGSAPTATLTDLNPPENSDTGAVTIPVGDGKVLGTPAYMSPEQARGQYLDYRTDIFSFGSTFYEMLTGQPPFQGRTSTGTISEILNKDPLPVASLNPETPSSVQWILDKCLEKDPSQRYQDTRDLVVDLRHVYPDTGPQTVPVTRAHGSWSAVNGAEPAKTRRWQIPILIGAALVVAALGFLGWQSNRPNQLIPPATEDNSLAVFAFENLKDPDDPERLGQILQELLITDLSGLEPLRVFSSQRLSDIERQLMRSSEDSNDKGVADAVAQQAGAQTMLTGSLSQLGDKWILTTQLTDVGNGTVLKSKRLDGEDLYAMVDQLTDEIQHEFAIELPGEMAEIAERPIKEKTSASIEAYKYYLGGIEHLDNNQFNEAVLELTRAVQIDPEFGQAYYNLAIATWWLYSDAGSGKEHMQKLLDNELYASAKEKRMAEGMLLVVENKWGDAIPVLEQLTRDYPDEKYVWYGLGEAQFHSPAGDKLSESLAAFERATALDPEFLLPYRHIFDVLLFEQRYEEAVARADQLLELDPDNPAFHRYRVTSIAIQADAAATERALEEALPHMQTAEDQREMYSAVGIPIGNLGYLELAETYLKKALEADPGHDDPLVLRSLIGYLWRQHKVDEVEKYTREALARDPDNDTYIEGMFEVHMSKSQYSEAHALARDLVERDSDDPRWYRHLAQCIVYSGDEKATERVIDEGAKRNSSTDDRRRLFRSVGWAYTRTGNYNKAKQYFATVMESDTSDTYSSDLTAMGYQERRSGHFSEAEKWYRKAQEHNPRNFDVSVHLSQVYMERGEFKAAIDELERGMKLLPPSELFPYMTYSLQILNGDLDQADAMLKELESSDVAESQLWDALVNGPDDFPMGLGWAYLLSGSPDRAKEVFERATEMEFSSRVPGAFEGLAWTCLFQGEYDAAEKAFSKALGIGYRHVGQRYGLAVLALLRGNHVTAERHVREGFDEGPSAHTALTRLLAQIYADQGRFEEARELAEQVFRQDSTRASQEFLSWVLIAGSLDVERGIELAKGALERPSPFSDVEARLPHRASAEHCLGLAYLKQGDTSQAVTHLRKAADLQPGRKAIQVDLRRALAEPSGTE